MEVSRRVTPISIKFNVKWDLLLKNSVSTYLDGKFPCITKGNIRTNSRLRLQCQFSGITCTNQANIEPNLTTINNFEPNLFTINYINRNEIAFWNGFGERVVTLIFLLSFPPLFFDSFIFFRFFFLVVNLQHRSLKVSTSKVSRSQMKLCFLSRGFSFLIYGLLEERSHAKIETDITSAS